MTLVMLDLRILLKYRDCSLAERRHLFISKCNNLWAEVGPSPSVSHKHTFSDKASDLRVTSASSSPADAKTIPPQLLPGAPAYTRFFIL